MNLLKYLLIVGVAVGVTACGSKDKDADTADVTIRSAVAGVEAGSQADLEVRAGNTVFFDYDKYALRPDATRTLQKQAAWLKMYPKVNIIIEGHTDERGTRKYNQALGERRANAAKRYLIAQGVSAQRITTVSYGKDRPAVLGHNEAAWSKNRRAVTIVAR
jgi:peptidoglycan-associated lipoprotein